MSARSIAVSPQVELVALDDVPALASAPKAEIGASSLAAAEHAGHDERTEAIAHDGHGVKAPAPWTDRRACDESLDVGHEHDAVAVVVEALAFVARVVAAGVPAPAPLLVIAHARRRRFRAGTGALTTPAAHVELTMCR
jgi:hypothetical protein